MAFLRKGTLVLLFGLMLFIVAGCSSQAGQQNISDQNDELTETSAPGVDVGTSQTEPPDPPSDTAPNQVEPPAKKVAMGEVTAVRLIDPPSGWVGGKGWIARTDNGGKDWKLQYQGEQTVQQLFALNGRAAWAVFGEDDEHSNERRLLQHTTDGGEHWSPVGKVPNSGFLHFVSMQEAFVGNAHSTDGGKTWSKLSVPEHSVGDAYFHDKKNGWAVVKDDDTVQVQRTVDGGKTWKTVMSRKVVSRLNGALIRSAGADDAWVELIGESGMTQTSYALFHTNDGGDNWQTVIANSTAGAGPAPGFPIGYNDGPENSGSSPGPLYVVSPKIAFMGGYCMACDNPNTVGWTTDGGENWNNGKEQFSGYGGMLLAISGADNGWLICTDTTEPSVMYTTSDGGKHWKKVHTFDRPKNML